jgi:hypothetical protein
MSKKAKKTKTAKKTPAAKGYKNHRAGTPSEKLHKLFDEKGQEAAYASVGRLGLEPHTARALFSRWNNPVEKKAKKTKGKKAAPKKAAPKKAKKAASKKPAAKRERLPTTESATA